MNFPMCDSTPAAQREDIQGKNRMQ